MHMYSKVLVSICFLFIGQLCYIIVDIHSEKNTIILGNLLNVLGRIQNGHIRVNQNV